MINPYQEELEEVTKLLDEALEKLDEASKSKLWSYTREYELGKLDTAKDILKGLLDELKS